MNQTVASIAEDSGFQTLQRFHAVFKDLVGLTPAGYRSTLKRGVGITGVGGDQ